MDPRLLQYYNRELQFIREMGGEFAKEFPKIAGRLGLEGFECADPYVERLLEGFAFLAGRIQLKLDAEFPRFTQHLLEAVYPHYLSPTPSMTVVRFQPDLMEGGLADGFTLPRDSAMRSLMGKHDQTACEYRTVRETVLWPLEVTDATYLRSLAGIDLPHLPEAKAGIRLRLRVTAGLSCDKLALESLPLYLQGADELPMHLYEQILGNAVAVVARPTSRPAPWQEVMDRQSINQMEFDDSEALLPFTDRSFEGYRLLHEYFAFPARFMFVELTGLAPAFKRCPHDEIELIILLNRSDTYLEKVVNADNFALFCTPAVNLFPKQCDRIHLTQKEHEHHLVPDRTRPLDYEVYSITGVTGYGVGTKAEQEFLPFYASHDLAVQQTDEGFFTLRRDPRVISSRQRRNGPRSSYIGSEVFLTLVDAKEAPYHPDLRQLGISTLCTNRDLPLQMPVGKGTTDFTLESGGPFDSVRVVAGPTRPRPSWAEGDTTWRLVSHLSLNYLSLIDNDEAQGAAALRELMSLYSNVAEAPVRKQIGGVKSITSKPIIRRVPIPGPIAFGRGLEITLTLNEDEFEGTGVFLLGAIMERFFGRYVSLNSFTQTVIRTTDRGEIMRWPLRTGQQHLL
ncbi:MAG: type VI secretion system protein ImpG [Gammaproteobacteria bacterium (ex Lamellibrachia satsuma)]|nr:MAG: type VI secretion system baseplate subunit TssF [Gammaproteobacteria bacterium (ex Lamellibrachia satsuma)]RRS31630.1 MAG: type VI secretion system protein ImpG [Gammaproteobacteria bacterium (ex Lamellibrachia satsuma)]RRS36121.1 MAG: type VI secretion system protein ImpG [Gammaproteobacteria bacterium (ex Lamellibrachia satsuma)]